MNENTQIVEATVSLPLARKQSLMSFESYVVGALKFGFMTPQDWLLTNRNQFLSLLCTTIRVTTVKRYSKWQQITDFKHAH